MLFYRLTDRIADLTTNCSVAAVDRYVRIKAAPAERIRYMAERHRHRPIPPRCLQRRADKRQELGLDDAFTWLAVGRMTEAEGLAQHARCGRCRRLPPADRLLIVGNGELYR